MDFDDDSGSFAGEEEGAPDRKDAEVGNVRVSVRIRPPNEDERTETVPGGPNSVECDGKVIVVNTGKRGVEPHPFSFDYVFDPASTQAEVSWLYCGYREWVQECLFGPGSWPRARVRQRLQALSETVFPSRGPHRTVFTLSGVRGSRLSVAGQGLCRLQRYNFCVRTNR